MAPDNSTSILSLFPLTADQLAAVTSQQSAISVTAGAGSGKTRTLVGRYLALLEQDLPLRSLVAITFTDKAAREMRNRIRALAADWLARVDNDSQRELWAEAFSALDAARISTIHALCATILRAHPAEAGLDPAFVVLDEGRSAMSRARAVEQGLAWAAADSEVSDLFRHFKEGQLRELLAELLEKRLDAAQTLAAVPADPLPVWSAALNRWLKQQLDAPAWQESLDALASRQAQAEDDKLEIARQEVLACWREARRAQEAQNWDALFAALLNLRGAIVTGGQKKNWAADDLTSAREAMAALRAYFDENLAQLVNKKKPLRWSLDQQAAQLLPLAQQLLAHTQTLYQADKSEARALDFDDLEQMTAHLLTTNPTVCARWQREINAVLLVDEFQDTNQRQREIVYALAGFAPSPNAALPPASSLFIVGDAKQSIYRFRGADVAVFRQVQADIQQAGGDLIDFNLTFRAHQSLVELTNALLSPLMPAEDNPAQPYDVPFASLTAHRQQPRDKMQPPYLEFQLGLGEDKAAGRAAAAVGLAGRLLELRQSDQIEWQDVALLFRASTAFGVYEDALEQAGVPFVTVAGRGFYDRPEVRDILNALAAIADPGDDLALAGLLRSPAIGLSDAALYLLRWDGPQRRPFWPALQNLSFIEGLTAEDRQQAEFARQLIADLHSQSGRVAVAQLLKQFLDETHYRAILRLTSGGERMRRNIDKLLADAHRSELVSVAEFLEYITALGDVGVRESEAPTEAGGAVQLMTIHKAKGLEFPVVALADAGYSGGFWTAPFYLDPDLGLLLNLSADEAQPAAFRLAACRAAAQEAAEERRLLYVAATRAMEKFIISGDAKLSKAKATPGKLLLSGWLADLAQVVGLNEVTLPDMPAASQSVALDWQDGAAACTFYSPTAAIAQAAAETAPLSAATDEAPDLLESLAAASPAMADEKLAERESDPPPRVWRVVPPSRYEVPAWVVGSLTHTALRYWRFPNDSDFTGFLRPFALEAGLTDRAAIDIALNRVTVLLARFQTHSLYVQLSAAERHHETPFSLPVDGQMQSGIIDLLFRVTPDAPWTIAEFKTDRLAAGIDLKQHAEAKEYLRQVDIYYRAVDRLLGILPQALLVFLNVGQSVQVLKV
jgi:ATP-dependent helicase/nuclease subunit A